MKVGLSYLGLPLELACYGVVVIRMREIKEISCYVACLGFVVVCDVWNVTCEMCFMTCERCSSWAVGYRWLIDPPGTGLLLLLQVEAEVEVEVEEREVKCTCNVR
jgi:hypothetical protein